MQHMQLTQKRSAHTTQRMATETLTAMMIISICGVSGGPVAGGVVGMGVVYKEENSTEDGLYMAHRQEECFSVPSQWRIC